MQNVILELAGSGSGTASPAVSAVKSSPLDGSVFRSTLNGQMPARVAPPAPTPATSPNVSTIAAVRAKIAALGKAGATQSDMVNALAASLAATVAVPLNAQPSEVSALRTTFAKALAPPEPDDGAGGFANALAQRYVDVSALATTIVNQSNGQQKRITGTISDAQVAKDPPVQTNGTAVNPADIAMLAAGAAGSVSLLAPQPLDAAIGRAAMTSVAVSASRPSGAAVRNVNAGADASPQNAASTTPTDDANAAAGASAPASAAPGPNAASSAAASAASGPNSAPSAAPGDTARVTFGTAAASSSGTDSLLGRILGRAANADAARQALVQTPTLTPPTTTTTANPAPQTPVAAFTAALEAALVPVTHSSISQSARDVTPSESRGVDGVPDGGATGGPVAPVAVDRVSAPPAQPVAAPATPIDHSAIADQVLRGAFMRTTGESSEMRLTLVPESLGDVTVKLVVSAGSVTAHVVAQTADVRDALVAAQPQLSKALAESGLKLTSFNVDLSNSGFAGFAQQQNGGSRNGHRPSASGGGEADDATDAGLEAIPSFGPSALATPGLGDYNYLA
jgi:flagellar hook-length control protein FliK